MRTNFSIARKSKIRSDIKEYEQRCAKQMLLKKREVNTNADRILAISDEELAEIIMCPYGIEPDLCCTKGTCLYCCEKRLKQPAEE